MLREWLTYLTTPCRPLYRRMGFLKEAVGIESRYRRHAAAWAGHLARTRATIETAVSRARPGGVALVFGGGLLYDIPLETLTERFAEVLLVDLVHMGPARRAARRHANLRLVEHDVTESLAHIAEGGLDPASPRRFLDRSDLSLVASVNILSQLPVVPNAYLERRFGADEAAQERLGRALVERHLDYLAGFACPVALVTDVARSVLDERGTEVGRIPALFGATLPWSGEEWDWDIAPLGEIDRSHAVRHRVRGIVDLRLG